MRDAVTFARLTATDLFDIDGQESQKMWLGIAADCDWETAAALAAQPVAWTARRADGSVLACFGINETFPGAHGVAWSLLSQPIGKDHLKLTRFMRAQIESCGLARIELMAAAIDIEETRAFFIENGAPVDSGILASVAMSDPTPECRLAVLLGFDPVHVLRKFGAAGESYMLFERIR